MLEIRAPIHRIHLGKKNTPFLRAEFVWCKDDGGGVGDFVVETKKATDSDTFFPIAVAAAVAYFKAPGRVTGFLEKDSERFALDGTRLGLNVVLQVYDSHETAVLAEENYILRHRVDELETQVERFGKLIDYIKETL